MYIDVHVKYMLFLTHLMKFEFSLHIFVITSNIKFNENPSSGSKLVPCGRTDGQERHDAVDNSFFCMKLMRLSIKNLKARGLGEAKGLRPLLV